MTLKSTLGSLKVIRTPFDRSHTSSYSSSIVNHGPILYHFRNKARYWSKNAPFSYALYLTCTIHRIFAQISTETVRVPELLGGAKIVPKIEVSAYNETIQTDG